jgi:hypothetical protein
MKELFYYLWTAYPSGLSHLFGKKLIINYLIVNYLNTKAVEIHHFCSTIDEYYCQKTPFIELIILKK